MTTRELTHLSLFSGIGGLDIAAEWAGFQTVGQCEWADYPTQILEQHWPGLPRWRDIRTLTKEDFHARTGRWTVDVVSGGFPCQPFSLAGSRRGTADDRYLWPELLRVVSKLRPTWVIGENVAGLLSMVQSSEKIGVESRSINRFEGEDHYEAVWARQENMLLVALIQDLERIGYAVQTFVIPACAVGARHRRDRIAIVAHRNGSGLEGSRPEQQATGMSRGCEDVGYAKHNGLSATAISAGAGTASGHHSKRAHQTGKFAGASGHGDGANVADAHGCGHVHEQNEVHPAETGEYAQRQSVGCGANVAHTQRVGSGTSGDYAHLDEKWNHQAQEQAGQAEPSAARSSSGTLCDPMRQRLSDGPMRAMGGAETYAELERPDRRSAQFPMGRVADGIPGWMDGYWLTEPDIPRVATGGLNRVDKLKALGNAVVPQQFYPIVTAIATIEQEA